MKVCVTGGAGYIGSHLVDRLVKLGHEVVVIDDLSNGSVIHPSTLFFSYDIRDIEHIKNALQGTEVFFHLAANKQATSTDNYGMISVNVGGTMAVLDIAKRVGARKFVFSSSAAVYPSSSHMMSERHANLDVPQNAYGLSKIMGEQACRFMADDTFSVTCLRYFNVWGGDYLPNNKVKSAIEIFRDKKAKGEPVKIYGDGTSMRDYIHVDDVVDANIVAMNQCPNFTRSSVWNVCTGKATTILEVVRKECGEDYPVEFVPARSNEIDYSTGCPDLGRRFGWVAARPYK